MRRPRPSRTRGVANTNVIWHAGKLLALEEAHLPTEIDPKTLATRGYVDYAQRVARPVTAHPKIDPVTGELIFFGYNATGPFSTGMTVGAIAASGVVNSLERFEAPYSSMVHDFIVTAKHVLFPILPLTGSMERAMKGLPAYAWEPDKGAYVGVMKRGGSAKDIRWFRGEACYVFHVMNAWEEGDTIVADVMHREAPVLFPAADGKPIPPEKQIARLARWTFDMADGSDTFTRVYLDDLEAEFPRIDDRRAGLANRHSWFAAVTRVRRRRHVQQHRPRGQHDRPPQALRAAKGRRHLGARVRVAHGRCSGGRRLAAGDGVAGGGEPQRSRRARRHRGRARADCDRAAREPRAVRPARQLDAGGGLKIAGATGLGFRGPVAQKLKRRRS